MKRPRIIVSGPGVDVDPTRAEHSYFGRAGRLRRVRFSQGGSETMLEEDLRKLHARGAYDVVGLV